MSRKSVQVQYFALLRERAGTSAETVHTAAATPAELYAELRQLHGFDLPEHLLKVAVNESYGDWQSPLKDGDRVVFLQPVAGG